LKPELEIYSFFQGEERPRQQRAKRGKYKNRKIKEEKEPGEKVDRRKRLKFHKDGKKFICKFPGKEDNDANLFLF
jgi:hypothetical protein